MMRRMKTTRCSRPESGDGPRDCRCGDGGLSRDLRCRAADGGEVGNDVWHSCQLSVS